MKISDIKAIMEIVQTRSMSKTAERLFITQSALSQLLSRVEAELDAPLFYRTPGKPLELSDVGEQFYAMAKEVISTYDAFLLGLRTKPLNIGISMRVGKYIIEAMQNAIPNFSPEHYTFSELTLAERRDGGPQPLGGPGVLQASRHSRPHKLLRDPARSHRHLPPEGKPPRPAWPPQGGQQISLPADLRPGRGSPSACRATPLASGR